MVENNSQNITEDEAALYDRQIRLWGLDAQKRLRSARALLVGVSGLGAEVAKNIILSGIKSITLLDDTKVTQEDFCSQFLVDRESLGQNRAESSLSRAQQLNPMVEVSTDTDCVADKTEEFFTQFDVVCVTCSSSTQATRINDICHRNNICFYAADVFGYYGYMFADLNEHEFAEEVPQKSKADSDAVEAVDGDDAGDGEPVAKKVKVGEQEVVTVKKKVVFSRLQKALQVDWGSAEMTKLIKRTPSAYFIVQVLLRFRDSHSRDPNIALTPSDREELLKLREVVAKEMNFSPHVVPEDFVSFCTAELSPVCAVVGGVLGQEIIKAVSQKDAPHNNFFIYNGVDGSGMVDCIGQ